MHVGDWVSPQLGKYDVTVEIKEFEPDRLISWTVLGQLRPQIGHVYGYQLQPTDDPATTVVTSFYDWSNIDPKWRDAGIFPVLSEGALRATLGILDRIVRRDNSIGKTADRTHPGFRAWRQIRRPTATPTHSTSAMAKDWSPSMAKLLAS
jgi:hypothetical protein